MAKGRYQKWLEPDSLLLLRAWARDGLTDEQIASNIGINVKTLYDWKNKYGNICNALKSGKEVIDIQVENALLKRALGYKFTEVIKESIYNPKTERFEFRVSKEVVKEVQPDTTAQIFWLKNRKPHDWRDKQKLLVDINGMNDSIKTLSDLINNPVEDREIPEDDEK